ncbi:MAG: hypothetical protein Q9168_005810 [Polycauliona sp. 1 TL-2023]
MVLSRRSSGNAALTAGASQNQPPAMRLRNRAERKAPRRFVEELEQGAPSQGYTIRLPNRGAYRGPVTEYNPSLPPAVFPTLDPRASVNNTHHTQHNFFDVPTSPLSPSSPHLDEQQPSETTSEAAQNMINANSRAPGLDPRLRREVHLSNPNHMDMIPFAGPELYDTSNGMNNPVWKKNMRRMEEMGQMDDYEVEAANMATSDEDEDHDPKVRSSKKAEHGSRPGLLKRS